MLVSCWRIFSIRYIRYPPHSIPRFCSDLYKLKQQDRKVCHENFLCHKNFVEAQPLAYMNKNQLKGNTKEISWSRGIILHVQCHLYSHVNIYWLLNWCFSTRNGSTFKESYPLLQCNFIEQVKRRVSREHEQRNFLRISKHL